jgi:hypothetical protein
MRSVVVVAILGLEATPAGLNEFWRDFDVEGWRVVDGVGLESQAAPIYKICDYLPKLGMSRQIAPRDRTVSCSILSFPC